MLKFEVKTLEGLDEGIAKLYKEVTAEDGTKVFRLQAEGIRNDEIPKMQAKLDVLLTEKKEEKRKREEAETAAAEAKRAQAEKDGDVEAIKKSMRDHFEPIIKKLEDRNGLLQNQVQQHLITDEAMRIATAKAVDTESIPTLAKLIEADLMVEEQDGVFSTVVKGANGKSSGLSVDEFSAKLDSNTSLARLIKANDAAGGGAKGGKNGAGGTTPKTVTRSQLEEMDAASRQTHFREGGTVTEDA